MLRCSITGLCIKTFYVYDNCIFVRIVVKIIFVLFGLLYGKIKLDSVTVPKLSDYCGVTVIPIPLLLFLCCLWA